MEKLKQVLAANRKAIVASAVSVGALLLVFSLGISVGYRQAAFSYHSGERFLRVFDDRSGNGFYGKIPMPLEGVPTGHGAIGKVVSVALPAFVVSGPDNMEKTVVIGSTTELRKFRTAVSSSEIKPEEFVVVLGDPDTSGRIQARFIRIAPQLPGIPLSR